MHHLMIVAEGDILKNKLYGSAIERAEDLIAWTQAGEFAREVQEAMREADEDGAAADYPEGYGPPVVTAEDYLDAIQNTLSSYKIEVFTDDLGLPEEPTGEDLVAHNTITEEVSTA
jgi:hypothetical protein